MNEHQVPIDRSYWVIPGQLLAGAYPGSKDFQKMRKNIERFVESGIRLIINLMEEHETDHTGDQFVPYEDELVRIANRKGTTVVIKKISIPDMDVPSPRTMREILDEIDDAVSRDLPVYVHCWGGKGRTGTVVGCYLVRHGLSGRDALLKIRELRKNDPTAADPSPQTRAQREMVLSWKRWEAQSAKPTELDRYRGSLLGLAVGDALGTTLEFRQPGTFEPITDMVGGGPFQLKPGEWTDDASMAFCLGKSLIECKGFDAAGQMKRYVKWYREGYMSSNGRCFDIGNTIREALHRFEQTGDPYSGPTHERANGNGSIMRLAPVPLFYARHPEKGMELAGESSRTTHGHRIAVDACRYMASVIIGALRGESKDTLLSRRYSPVEKYWVKKPLIQEVDEIAMGSFKRKDPPEIKASGYVVKTLEAALWAFYKSDSFDQGCLMAVNLGDDADTVGAVYGQIAGAFYGERGIPEKWRQKIARKELILEIAEELSAGRE